MMAPAPVTGQRQAWKTPVPVSLSTNFHQKKRLAGDHRTICREETMRLCSVTKLIAFNSLMDSVLCVSI